MEIFKIVVLSLSGLLLIYAGMSRLFNPIQSFCLQAYVGNPDGLAGKVDLFNEMRGAGANLALAGIVIGLGTVLPGFRMSSHVVAAVVFVGFAAGRVISSRLDGTPNKDLAQGLTAEVALGVANLAALGMFLV